MSSIYKLVRKFKKKWPGEKYFGNYRFLPMFFVLGAALEFSMINWHVGETNFYRTYKKSRVQDIVEERLRTLQLEPEKSG